MGIVNIPILSPFELSALASAPPLGTPSSVSLSQVSDTPVSTSSTAASTMGPVSRNLTLVCSRYYAGIDCSDITLQILLDEHSPRSSTNTVELGLGLSTT